MKEPDLYDNTRVSCAKKCLRKYYYRHILNWVGIGRKPASLAFGSAWHAAMDVIWQLHSDNPQISPEELVTSAMIAFNLSWNEDGFPTEDSEPFGISMAELEPRTPYNAMEMLYAYINQRQHLMEGSELLAVEKPFIVPLSTDLSTLYIGKLDKVVMFEGKPTVIEHKTTTLYSKASGVRPSYLDSFSPNSQVDGYIHAMKMLYGEKAYGVFADVALVHKHVHDAFALQPIRKQKFALQEFIDDTTWWISKIQECKEMDYWPKNTGSCFDFGKTCVYADLCKGRNFHQVMEAYEGYNGTDTYPEPLPGYRIEVWDPVQELKINLKDITDEQA